MDVNVSERLYTMHLRPNNKLYRLGLLVLFVFLAPLALFVSTPLDRIYQGYPQNDLSLSNSFSQLLLEVNSTALYKCADRIASAVNESTLPQTTKDFLGMLAALMNPFSAALYQKSLLSTYSRFPDSTELKRKLAKHSSCFDETVPSVAVCSIQLASGPFLEEWLAHYLLIGVNMIIIYDSGNPLSSQSKHMRGIAQPFVQAGFVEIIDWYFTSGSGSSYHQVEAYDHCLKNKTEFSWIGMLDIDEFVVLHPPKTPCLNHFLVDYQQYGALAMQWRNFVPRGVVNHNHSLLHFEQYHWTREEAVVKLFFNRNFTTSSDGPHNGHYVQNKSAVNFQKQREEGFIIHHIQGDPFQEIEVSHFWSRDWMFTFFDKLCGQSDEREHWLNGRMRIMIEFANEDNCRKVEPSTRYNAPLRSVLGLDLNMY